MYHIKNDQRSIHSTELLYTGLVELMHKMPFDTIKVKDLVRVSHVGRTTFYRNFDEIEDILRLQSDKVFNGMIQYVIAYIQEYGNESRVMLLKPILRYFDLHSEIIELLLQADRLDIAMASFRRAVEAYKARAFTYLGIDETYIEYNVTIRIGIIMNILVQWIESDKQEPADELADTLSGMIKSMVTLDQLL